LLELSSYEIAGFVGSRLCQRLIASGAQEVRAVDLRFFSRSTDRNEEETQNAEPDGEIIEIEIDLTKDCTALRSAFEGADVVFHLASAGMSGYAL
jgi:nucleoside-diphosphate-sugar epimerase